MKIQPNVGRYTIHGYRYGLGQKIKFKATTLVSSVFVGASEIRAVVIAHEKKEALSTWQPQGSPILGKGASQVINSSLRMQAAVCLPGKSWKSMKISSTRRR